MIRPGFRLAVPLGLITILLVWSRTGSAAEPPPTPAADLYGDPLPQGAVARLGTVRLRARCAWCLAFSGDGKLLAVGNSDATARLWDTVKGREVLRIEGKELGQICQIAWSPDGNTLATFDNGTLRFWDARTGKHLRQAKEPLIGGFGDGSVFTFSQDSRTLYVQRPDSVAAIAVADGKTVALPAAPEKGLTLWAVGPDGATAVSVAKGGRLVVWDLQKGKTLAEITVPRDSTRVALSRDAKRLAVATSEAEPTIMVWDLTSCEELCRCIGHRAEISSLSFSPNGKTLATGSRDLTARLWDAESGKERWSYRAFTVYFCWVGVAFSPDGKTVGVVGWDGIVRILDADTGKERVPVPGHLAEVGVLAVTPDGKTVFTSSNDQSLRQWDIATGKETRVLKTPGLDVYDPKQRKVVHAEEWISRLELTPDGKALAVEGCGIRMWDLSDPDRPRAGELVDRCVRSALAPDGKTLATLSDKLRLLDIRTKKVFREADVEDGRSCLCFSPDGRTLATAGEKEVVRLYDVQTLQERAVLRGGGVQPALRIVFSPDGQLVAVSGMERRVTLWEVASGQLRRRIDRGQSGMDALAFSPDGRYLAIAGDDPTVAIQDITTGRVVHAFRGHETSVICLAFTPDGSRLISGSYDTTALVWDMQAVRAPEVRQAKRTPKELDELWERLASDAEKADAAMRELAASPTQGVDLVRRSLKPAEKADTKRIGQWMRDLDNDSFEVREKASAGLEELGEDAAEALREALGGTPTPEVRRRAEELLGRLKDRKPSSERMRGLRAVQLLEWIGTAEAQRVLEAVAAGAPGAERTRMAAGALACLKKR